MKKRIIVNILVTTFLALTISTNASFAASTVTSITVCVQKDGLMRSAGSRGTCRKGEGVMRLSPATVTRKQAPKTITMVRPSTTTSSSQNQASYSRAQSDARFAKKTEVYSRVEVNSKLDPIYNYMHTSNQSNSSSDNSSNSTVTSTTSINFPTDDEELERLGYLLHSTLDNRYQQISRHLHISTETDVTGPAYEGDGCMIGEIRLFGGRFSPKGWLPANGQLLQVSEHMALFSVLGLSHGGDGRNTFALPDFRYEGVDNTFYIICVDGTMPSRN